MKALIDGDVLVYRCGYAAEGRSYKIQHGEFGCLGEFKYRKDVDKFMEDMGIEGCEVLKHITPDLVENALHSVKLQIASILEYTKADSYQCYLSGSSNYRKDIATIKKYKGNRDNNVKPVHYQAIRDYLVNVHGAVVTDGIEADDAMGIAQTANFDSAMERYTKYEPDDSRFDSVNDYQETIICSIDKDLDTIPGWHYNFVKQEKYFVDATEAMRNFYRQLITGDTVDNIAGVLGRGQKAAKVLDTLTTEREMCCYVGKLYAEAFDDPEQAMTENGQLLWIQRKPNQMWSIP